MPDSFVSSRSLVFRSHLLTKLAAALVTVVGLMVLIGWIADIDHFKSVYGPITMKVNSAIALILGGVSLFGLTTTHKQLNVLSQICAGFIALIGLATLSEHLIGWNLGIDELLFRESPGAVATSSPGRMGITASTCFVLFGTSLLILQRGRGVSLAQGLTLIGGLWVMLTLVGYAYQAEQLYAIAQYTGIALHTALSFFLSCMLSNYITSNGVITPQ